MAEKQVAPDARTFGHLFRILRFVRDAELLEPWLLATLREMALLRISTRVHYLQNLDASCYFCCYTSLKNTVLIVFPRSSYVRHLGPSSLVCHKARHSRTYCFIFHTLNCNFLSKYLST